MYLIRFLLTFGWFIHLFALYPSPKPSITLIDSFIRVDLPDKIYFSIEASSTWSIEKITLLYQSNARSCQEGVARQQLDFEPRDYVITEWAWELKFSGTIPPGTQLTWQWEIEDNHGNKLLTEPQTATVEDDVYQWQKLEEDNLSVWWVEGGQAFGRQMLKLSQESLDRLEKEVGVRPSLPVILVIYPNITAMQEVLLYEPDWTGGQAFWDYGIVVMGFGPQDTKWAKEVVPHELAHVVTRELMFNCYGVQAPTWLIEGLAVYLEGPADLADIQALEAALKNDSLTSLRNLASGFAANPAKVNMDYAQSGEVVRFLIETYGPEKMAALLAALQSGKIIDIALQAVYGLNTDGVDASWRQSWGYEATIPTLESTSQSAKPERTPVPTLALWTSVAQAPTATATITVTPLPPTHTPKPPSMTPQPTELPVDTVTVIPTESNSPGTSGLPCGSLGIAPLALIAYWATNRTIRRRHTD